MLRLNDSLLYKLKCRTSSGDEIAASQSKYSKTCVNINIDPTVVTKQNLIDEKQKQSISMIVIMFM